jgi:hypothetical protein
MSIEDLTRPGRPSTSRNEENIEKVRQAINEDRRKTIEQVSEETNVSWSSCQRILTDLRIIMLRPTRLCPTVLGEEQHGPSAPPTLLARPTSVRPFFYSHGRRKL